MTRTSSHLFAGVCGLALLCATSGAAAKPPKHRKTDKVEASAAEPRARKHGKRRHAEPAAAEAPVASPEPKSERPAGSAETQRRVEAQRRAAQDAALGADAQVVREGETQVKVMSFEGLDIEGRLKSPQLLYFVGRVHAEFDRPTLPHRSFIPELESSTHTAPVQ